VNGEIQWDREMERWRYGDIEIEIRRESRERRRTPENMEGGGHGQRVGGDWVSRGPSPDDIGILDVVPHHVDTISLVSMSPTDNGDVGYGGLDPPSTVLSSHA
jgi:hypothetical protein